MSLFLSSSQEIQMQTSLKDQEYFGLKLKKQMAKIKNTKSKQFKSQNLIIVPIYQNRHILNHQFIIQGYVQIETQYRDFSSIYEQELVPIYKQNLSINSIVNNYKQKQIELNIESKYGSGLKDFQFLIDYFNQSSDIRLKELGEQMQIYQNYVNQKQLYWQQQSVKLKARIISQEDIQQALYNYEQYIDEYTKQHFKEDDLLLIGIFSADFEEGDLQIKKYKVSYSVFDAVGICINNPSQYEILQQITQVSRLLGKERIEEAILKFKFFGQSKGSVIFEQPLVTSDQIHLNVTFKVQFIDWPEKPEFLQDDDLVGYVLQIQISPEQLQKLKEVRANQNDQTLSSIPSQTNFESEIYSEIFIEKYYSDQKAAAKQKKIKKQNY
ncbi:hypothetical protein TTHERM_00584590 (macronuclear) [Tetrahymena thermophila SB210]|uniref:Uncharacterized protein n=1 Tax=Tetrahymena thermophila (strain SB210) TaxID=312017 RepID=I7MCT6_TETTS|nr:hypothetical protein TTHERM_00584590 [Tetrahymena thermophila SB210]EAR84903.2 hypothetical protein TTHERM_00584590 [Tetrahymena thermophila SB210]|eukprot:XP_001032566.2 hypothetical protein TTHERM_00584590 [Tetrahymena thermophila SB210]